MVNARFRKASVFASLACVLVLFVPAGVAAEELPSIYPRMENGAVVDVTRATFDSKLMATIDVTVTCEPLTYWDYDLYQEVTTTSGRAYVDVVLLQAQGRKVAAADGGGLWPEVTCDGATLNELSVQVITLGIPLRRGDVLVGARLEISAGMYGELAWAQSGPMPLKLR